MDAKELSQGRALYERLHELMPADYPDAWVDLLETYKEKFAIAAIPSDAAQAPRAWEVEWPDQRTTDTWHKVFINERDALEYASYYAGAIITSLYAAPVAADAAAPSDERADALQDMAFVHGLQTGYQFGLLEDHARYEKCIASRDGYLKVLRETRAAAQPNDRAALVQLFKEAIAWGSAYGAHVPTHQWDDMRDTCAANFSARATAPQAVALTNEQRHSIDKAAFMLTIFSGHDSGANFLHYFGKAWHHEAKRHAATLRALLATHPTEQAGK